MSREIGAAGPKTESESLETGFQLRAYTQNGIGKGRVEDEGGEKGVGYYTDLQAALAFGSKKIQLELGPALFGEKQTNGAYQFGAGGFSGLYLGPSEWVKVRINGAFGKPLESSSDDNKFRFNGGTFSVLFSPNDWLLVGPYVRSDNPYSQHVDTIWVGGISLGLNSAKL